MPTDIKVNDLVALEPGDQPYRVMEIDGRKMAVPLYSAGGSNKDATPVKGHKWIIRGVYEE